MLQYEWLAGGPVIFANWSLSMTAYALQLLERVTQVLPLSDDDFLLRGITAEATDRLAALKKTDFRLRGRYGSPEQLQRQIKAQGISPDDHGLYTDLLEWHAARHELSALVELLETF
jgi:hypothetical protein